MHILFKSTPKEEIERLIIGSDVFKKCMNQMHHKHTTVGSHMIEVKDSAMAMCRAMQGMGFAVDDKSVLVAALCHDLGMADRDLIFSNNYQCWREHPKLSVLATKKLINDLDKKTEQAISNHMWPLSAHMPQSREAWIVMLADKYVSIRGVFGFAMDKTWRRRKAYSV